MEPLPRHSLPRHSLPRHPALDDELATRGLSPSVLQVYADWLMEQGHPFGTYLQTAARAAAGDRKAAEHVRESLHAFHAVELEPMAAVQLELGVVVGLVVDRALSWDSRKATPSLEALWEAPLTALCCSVRVMLEGDMPVAELLSGRPPSAGRLCIVDPKFPFDPSWSTGALDLGGLPGPSPRWLTLKAASLQGLPALPRLKRLELAAYAVDPLLQAPLPELEVAHLWEGVPHDVIDAVLASPRLRTLGLHTEKELQIDAVLSWPWPRGLREVWLVGDGVDPMHVRALAAALPAGTTLHVPSAGEVPEDCPLFG